MSPRPHDQKAPVPLGRAGRDAAPVEERSWLVAIEPTGHGQGGNVDRGEVFSE